MPENFSIIELTDRNDPAWVEVEKLFIEMYEFMSGHGLGLGLSDDGHSQWIDSVKRGLGRFGVLFTCTEGEEITGFAHGSIRLTPDYMGNKKMGVITHIHMKEGRRKRGSGTALVKALELWFDSKDVHSVELQVLSANHTAIGFWEKLGYYQELHQYRKVRDDL